MNGESAYVVFSDDWGKHPSSCQHIVRHLAARHRIEWINTIGMRSPRPTLVDLRKAVEKVGSMLRGPADEPAGSLPGRLTVHQPAMLPYSTIPAVRRFNARSVRKTLAKVTRRLGPAAPVVLTTVPNSCDYVDGIEGARVVYYCVDDFSEWPGFNRSMILEMETKLIGKADVLVATSPALYERLAASGKPTHLLAHGVDLEHFSARAQAAHPVLDNIPSPRIGYFGLFDDRSDKALLEGVARRLPQVSIVITGRVETAIEDLAALPNVHFTGAIPYAELPALITGLDVLFIAYIVDELSRSLSPLKLKEYLATGLPVVSTPIEAVREFEDVVHTASTVEQWSHTLGSLLEGAELPRRLPPPERLAAEGWDMKAAAMDTICRGEVVAAKTASG